MTATAVNGISVILDTPARAPITNLKTGGPIYWEQIRELSLADGSTVYGCLHCDYTNENRNSLRPHLNAHRIRQPKLTTNDKAVVAAQERTIAILGKELDKAERKVAKALAGEREAKAEARKARRDLDALRSILAPSLEG